MTKACAISGTFADFKLVKTRGQAQLVVEIPIEQAQAALEVFGVPQPGKEVPVAVARLTETATEKPVAKQERKPWGELLPAQQAGIRCADPEFQKWIIGQSDEYWVSQCRLIDLTDEEIAVSAVHALCDVSSRKAITTGSAADGEWQAIQERFMRDTGRMAEVR